MAHSVWLSIALALHNRRLCAINNATFDPKRCCLHSTHYYRVIIINIPMHIYVPTCRTYGVHNTYVGLWTPNYAGCSEQLNRADYDDGNDAILRSNQSLNREHYADSSIIMLYCTMNNLHAYTFTYTQLPHLFTRQRTRRNKHS